MQLPSGWWILPMLVINFGLLATAVAAFGFMMTVGALISVSLLLVALSSRLYPN